MCTGDYVMYSVQVLHTCSCIFCTGTSFSKYNFCISPDSVVIPFKMKYYSTRMNRVLHIPKISASSTNGTICKQKINSLLNFLVYAWPDIFMLALLNSSLKWCDPIRNVQNSTAAFRCCIVVSIDKTKLITSWFVPNKKEIDCYFKTPHKNNFTS